jgi:hypothetical protein
MRFKLSVAAAMASMAAGATILLAGAAPSASAIACPAGTIPRTITVAGVSRTICVPGVQCDPGPCDPTAAPPEQ